MPIYDFECPSCNEECHELLSYSEYDETEEFTCPKCEELLTKHNRIIGRGLKTVVTGPGKGNHNSNDWS